MKAKSATCNPGAQSGHMQRAASSGARCRGNGGGQGRSTIGRGNGGQTRSPITQTISQSNGADVPQRRPGAHRAASAASRQIPSEPLWGLLSSIDIYDCDPATIRDADKIRRFVRELCELIEMRRFGDTLVVHFGEDERVAGYSMVQLIETSLISAHFANLTNTVYLDVFSCKMYDPQVVESFAREFFGGARCVTHVTPRA